MKITQQRLNEARRQRTEAIVARHIDQLFLRLPMLLGFFLGPDLQVAELSVYRWAGYIDDVDLRDKVMQSLADLVEERPEAMVLMRGRTFARVVH